MKQSAFSESTIVTILKEFDAGAPAHQLCDKHGMSPATFYQWKSKYSNMDTIELTRVRELEKENRRLKKQVDDISADNTILREFFEKKL